MPKKDLRQLKSGKDFIDHAKKKGASVRQGKGSHQIIEHNHESFPVPVHSNRDLPTGLRAKLIKWLIRIGLAILGLIGLIAWIIK